LTSPQGHSTRLASSALLPTLVFGATVNVEIENPHGEKVSAPVLRATAGKEFIAQLRSLIAYVKEKGATA
jgi:hypothetical protein